MLIKILFYATFLGVFSSREIESKLKTDTAFMYLAAMQTPSYRTIIRFRTRFFSDIEPVFQQIVQICQELGLVGLNHIAFDGTKIKANASSKQTMSIEKLQRRIKKLLKKAMMIDNEEDDIFGDGTPFVIPKECTDDPDLMQKLEKLVTAYNTLQNSDETKLNLTDEDAHVMKSKQSYLPSYNVQAAIDDKSHIIVAMDVTTDENDLHQLIPMVELACQNTSSEPMVISADPGYASYENYQYLKDRGLFALIPDTMYFIENHGRPKYYPKSRFIYRPDQDCYTCPAGRTMSYVRIQKDKKGNQLGLYRGNCEWCPLHLNCTKASRRTISRHPNEELKDEMRQRLMTPDGRKEYGKRITVAEGPFGNMKYNKRWIQLSHRGRKKVKGECLLHGIGHNLGIICSKVPIEMVQKLECVQWSSKFLADEDYTPSLPLTFSCGEGFVDSYGGISHKVICQNLVFTDPWVGNAATC